jgi:hypothetical protein
MLRLASVIGLVLGFVSLLGWIDWANIGPCSSSSSELISPDVCPFYPTPIEFQGLLIALISLIIISTVGLIYSSKSRTAQRRNGDVKHLINGIESGIYEELKRLPTSQERARQL